MHTMRETLWIMRQRAEEEILQMRGLSSGLLERERRKAFFI